MTNVVERDASALEQDPALEPPAWPNATEVSNHPPPRPLVVVTCRQPDPLASKQTGNRGGLVAALAPVIERSSGTWVAGDPTEASDGSPPPPAAAAPSSARAGYRSVAVEYAADLHEGFYSVLSNGVLWPTYHSMPQEGFRCTAADWEDYCLVNRRFAEIAGQQAGPDSFIWVHDYQLSLVPGMLRQGIRDGTRADGVHIGFFLHTPFPPVDVFRVLPWAREILRGMLGADVIGFHTEDYRRNFADCVRRLLGVACEPNSLELRLNGRRIKLHSVPVGIDTQAMYRLIEDPWVRRSAARIRRNIGTECLLLGVDRMDYTKGIDRRLDAIDQLFERYPEWRGRATFAQIAVPSRTEVDGYRSLRRRVERLCGAINGRWGREDWTPVRLLCRSYPLRELAAWYLAADVALVTPLRDGMNLVAKEYCAANNGQRGVLVLSELAGAAEELGDALLVNPFYLEGLTDGIHRALKMPEEEARSRMRRLNQRIQACDAHYWVETFLASAAPVSESPRAARPGKGLP